MKQYNRLFIISFLLYGVLALAVGAMFYHVNEQQERLYRVEINRIMDDIQKEQDIEAYPLDDYKSIEQIEYLPITQTQQEQVVPFFEDKNAYDQQIKPYYEQGQVKGYLKFMYHVKGYPSKEVFILVELCLLLMQLSLFVYIWYLKRAFFKPIDALASLPMQMAKGHYKEPIYIGKNQYMKRFILGMGQLNDTLEVTRKRELALMKEKKKMVLSLSHDIKTPLHLITLYSKALEEQLYDEPSQHQKVYQQIQNKAYEIEGYLEKIVESSREELFDFQFENGEFYLQDLWDRVMRVYQEQCTLRQIHLHAKAFENRILQGNIERSQEVLENIFENAFKYGDGRTIEVDFYEEDFCQLIRIYNSGSTIVDHELPHLFDSFFRGSNAQGKQGSGLGLYICKELMRKMNGDIFAIKEATGMAFILVFR